VKRDFLAARAAEVLRAAGAREVVRMDWAPVLLHIHTTMRRGAVVDADGESLAVERLFVADNSALPNALGGPNPTLTTQALATRTAERIFTRYFSGDPWVARESPMSSVDDSVTAAVAAAGLSAVGTWFRIARIRAAAYCIPSASGSRPMKRQRRCSNQRHARNS
jgi:hypothetical protein